MTVSLSIYMSGKLSPTLDTVVLNIGLTPQPQRDANVRNRRQTESNIKLAFIHRRGATVRNRLLTTVKSRTLRDERPSLLGLSRVVTEEDKVKPHLKTRERSDRVEDLSFGPTDRREVRWGIKEQIQSSPGGATQAHKLRNPYGLSM